MLRAVVALVALAAVLVPLAGASAQTGAPPASPGTSGSDPARGGHAVAVEASSIIGSTVRNAEGKDIGKVYQLMIDPRDGRVVTAIISIGGTLGLGGHRVSVPWSAVKVGRDERNIVLSVDQQLLDTAPGRAEGGPRGGGPTGQPSASPPSGGSSPSPAPSSGQGASPGQPPR